MKQSEILDCILNELESVPDHKITGVVCGAHIVAVESMKCGIATWASGHHPVSLDDLPVQPLKESARETARFLLSEDALKASIGLATINSLLPDPAPECLKEINAGDLILQYGKGKNVVVIGHFPFVENMGKRFADFKVLEKNPRNGDLDEREASRILPRADLVAITATTLSNGTLAGILDLTPPDSVKMLIGPSTPLCTALFDVGIDILAGTLVKDNNIVKEGITLGCSFKQLKGVKHVVWMK